MLIATGDQMGRSDSLARYSLKNRCARLLGNTNTVRDKSLPNF